MRSLRAYVVRYWPSICCALLFLAVEAVCDLLQPTLMARIVDDGIANRDLDTVISLMVRMFLITGLGAVAAVGRNIISSRTSAHFGADIRSALYRRIQGISFTSFDRFETGSLITRLTNDVTQVQMFFNGMMRIFVKAPILAVGSITMAVLLNPRMSLVLVAVIPVIILFISINFRIGFPLFSRVQQALDKVNTVTREYLEGVRVVKAFNRARHERRRFAAANTALADTTTRAMRVMAFFGPGIMLCLNTGIAAVLWFGALRVQAGGMQAGQIIAFTNYMMHVMFSLMIVSMVVTTFARARASANRIGEVLEAPDAPAPETPAILPADRSGLAFNGVRFAYGGAAVLPVLDDIRFTVAPGETIGIIGSTGSGKSTLMNLVQRFYDPTAGTITLDGVDLKELDPAVLRGRIAVVPQKTTLFTGTIGENIR